MNLETYKEIEIKVRELARENPEKVLFQNKESWNAQEVLDEIENFTALGQKFANKLLGEALENLLNTLKEPLHPIYF